jgi:Flp pilus assembly protein TadG
MQTWTSFSQQLLRLRGRLREERGQAIVEFAVVLPVLVMIILGILYFGRYEDYTNQETQLAEMGVRWAAVDNNPGASAQTLQQYIQSQAQPELRTGSSDVTQAATVYVYYPSGSGGLGNPVRVCVVAKVSFPTPVTLIAPTIAQAATMRIEQPATGAPVHWTRDLLSTAQAAGCP